MNSFKIEQDSSNYKALEVLGEGTYGKVYKAVEVSTGKFVAIKRTKSDKLKEGISSINLREICFLKSLKHFNIVQLKGVVLTDKTLDLIFEYMACDLRQYIEYIKTPVPDTFIKKFLYQILSALHFCHTNRVIHRDLKPQNLLIDSNFNVKLADFGLARNFQIPIRPYTPCVQTLWYRAPEILLGAKSYSTAIDIWSVGCIFAEMVTTSPLFVGSSEIDMIYSIFKVLGTPSEETYPGISSYQYYNSEFQVWNKITLKDIFPDLCLEGVDLLSRMISLNPINRISAFDALKHVIFT